MVAGTDACGAAAIIPGFALHEIAGVMRNGSWWPRAGLDAVLEKIAANPGAH
jgi:hypothetical protein